VTAENIFVSFVIQPESSTPLIPSLQAIMTLGHFNSLQIVSLASSPSRILLGILSDRFTRDILVKILRESFLSSSLRAQHNYNQI
jgi:hypothetical protein